MYPRQDTQAFNHYLGKFLENVTANKTKLTILGDINIDLNKSNPVSHEYLNTLSSVGFNALIKGTGGGQAQKSEVVLFV